QLVYATFLDAGVSKKQLDMKFDQLFQAIYTRFRTAEGYALFPDVVPTLNELKRRGFQMGVISNSDDCLVDVIQSLRLDHYFDFILPSCMAGFEKPHGRIFQKALTLASPGITPEAALHIGDDLQK
ncbi:HAD-like domain-containing protein, partial [Radiomyces spectabilis]|uniref:HAD-like domain-containing protein n=1 Tax=Radiomyces spectabilis TaxID=64574 RepID=UPI00221E6CE0